jgi:hypothetical protein
VNFKNKMQYAAISRRIHDYLVPSLNEGANCISPSRLRETVFPLEEKFNNAISDGTILGFFPPSFLLFKPERTGYKKPRARHQPPLEAISKEFTNTQKLFQRVLGAL